MQVDLLVHPLVHRIAVQAVLQQGQGHDQRQQPLPVVLYEAQEFLLVLTREVLLQVAHQMLEHVCMFAWRTQHAQALHEHGPILGRQLLPIPLSRVRDEAAHLGVVLGTVGHQRELVFCMELDQAAGRGLLV
jgi:hypothetical protein